MPDPTLKDEHNHRSIRDPQSTVVIFGAKFSLVLTPKDEHNLVLTPKDEHNHQSIRDPRLIAIVFSVTCIVVLYLNAYYLTKGPYHIHGGMIVLCSIIGGLVGWALAVLATPDRPQDTMQFNAYAKIIAGFLSGFLFTKLNGHGDALSPFVKKHLVEVGFASGYTFAFFLIGLMWTFLVRRYTRARGELQQEPAKTDKPACNNK